ncbi:PH domain-containing protein [Saxibacter everestensis]|uniref:PH domain-containing protein n=1 Tax=Saxibacter everestensis TaxID=2909229 RepID=A0ABY8QPU6_9MICO|nr:PH domain-containing protein [Brevibacteriaceae bacterium ZFBP1038]
MSKSLVDDPLSPPGLRWVTVSPALIKVRLIFALIWCGIPLIAAIVLAILLQFWLFWALAGAALLLLGWLCWIIPRQVRALKYAERDDDLLIARGVMFRSLVVVPYGRMQYVDMSAGPVERSVGISTVKLHTASASTDATIPGLPADEAARLREQLASRGEARLAGL